jgi:hypothetical protein
MDTTYYDQDYINIEKDIMNKYTYNEYKNIFFDFVHAPYMGLNGWAPGSTPLINPTENNIQLQLFILKSYDNNSKSIMSLYFYSLQISKVLGYYNYFPPESGDNAPPDVISTRQDLEKLYNYFKNSKDYTLSQSIFLASLRYNMLESFKNTKPQQNIDTLFKDLNLNSLDNFEKILINLGIIPPRST